MKPIRVAKGTTKRIDASTLSAQDGDYVKCNRDIPSIGRTFRDSFSLNGTASRRDVLYYMLVLAWLFSNFSNWLDHYYSHGTGLFLFLPIVLFLAQTLFSLGVRRLRTARLPVFFAYFPAAFLLHYFGQFFSILPSMYSTLGLVPFPLSLFYQELGDFGVLQSCVILGGALLAVSLGLMLLAPPRPVCAPCLNTRSNNAQPWRQPPHSDIAATGNRCGQTVDVGENPPG